MVAAREKLLAEIERYLRSTGTSATAFGRAVAGDPRLVFDLRKGREPSARLMDAVAAFIAQSSPAAQPVTTASGIAGRRILLIIGGGIAAYKALDLIRRLRERGA